MGELAKNYTTVKNEASAEFEEKRSLFIGHAIHIENEEDAMAFVKKIKGGMGILASVHKGR